MAVTAFVRKGVGSQPEDSRDYMLTRLKVIKEIATTRTEEFSQANQENLYYTFIFGRLKEL